MILNIYSFFKGEYKEESGYGGLYSCQEEACDLSGCSQEISCQKNLQANEYLNTGVSLESILTFISVRRKRIVAEMVSTEQTYVTNLHTILEVT